MKKVLVMIGCLALAGVVTYSQRTTLVARLMERGLEARMGADVVAEMDHDHPFEQRVGIRLEHAVHRASAIGNDCAGLCTHRRRQKRLYRGARA